MTAEELAGACFHVLEVALELVAAAEGVESRAAVVEGGDALDVVAAEGGLVELKRTVVAGERLLARPALFAELKAGEARLEAARPPRAARPCDQDQRPREAAPEARPRRSDRRGGLNPDDANRGVGRHRLVARGLGLGEGLEDRPLGAPVVAGEFQAGREQEGALCNQGRIGEGARLRGQWRQHSGALLDLSGSEAGPRPGERPAQLLGRGRDLRVVGRSHLDDQRLAVTANVDPRERGERLQRLLDHLAVGRDEHLHQGAERRGGRRRGRPARARRGCP